MRFCLFLKPVTYIFCFYFLNTSVLLFAQSKNKLIVNPINQNISLSGTFGELRANHLHSGIDIRTNGEEGWKVFSIDNGYVSRININSSGFGKTIYINHLNGLVSVYAHLLQFNAEIELFVKSEQYQQKTFEGNFYPKVNQIKVAKGSLIALSGNSGSSGGPHLHFEIRDSLSQHPINPETYISISDRIKPSIQALVVYPIDAYSKINGKNSKLMIPLKNGTDALKKLKLSGKIGFGVQVLDYHDSDNNSNGIYSIKLKKDNTQILHLRFDRFSFDQTRYANSVCDYEYLITKNLKVYKCFVEPGNKLPIYNTLFDRGIINFSKTENVKVSISAYDFAGNSDQLSFIPQIDTSASKNLRLNNGIEVDYKSAMNVEFENIKLKFDAETFFDTVWISCNETLPMQQSYSQVFEILPQHTPIFKKFSLSIACKVPDSYLQTKLLLCWFNGDNKAQARGGEYADGYLTARVNQFGKYCVMVDTIPPNISLPNFTDEADLTLKKSIRLKLSDNLSGISKYEGIINGNWVVFEWDPKNEIVEYFVDDKAGKGPEYLLIFTAVDNCGNKNIFKRKYVRK